MGSLRRRVPGRRLNDSERGPGRASHAAAARLRRAAPRSIVSARALRERAPPPPHPPHPRSMPEIQTKSADTGLVRAVGVWGLAASIVNVTVGGGIFRLPAAAASTLGRAAPLAYLVCALAMGLIVLCFAEAGSRV